MAQVLTRPFRTRLCGEEGMGLVVSLLVTLVVFSLGAVWIGIGTHSVAASGREALREQARNAAEAGLNYAMGQLTADPYWGTTETAPIPLAGGGEFTVVVSAVSFDPADTRRAIEAKGYAPSRDHPKRVGRRVKHQVDLLPVDGFTYALFAAPGGVTGDNHMTVTGDIYSASDLVLTNNTTVNGNVVSLGAMTTSNDSTIGGYVHAAGNVTLDNSKTTVIGDVRSGGNVALTGRVKGSVTAAGTITGGTVDGSRNPYSNPPPPRAQTLPTFTWDPTNYPSTMSWSTAEDFEAHWYANRATFSGHDRISCAVACNTIDLDHKWSMSDDVTIVTDGPIVLSREITNVSSPKRPLTLTIVSEASTVPVRMTNNLVLEDVKMLIYAPNGTVEFANLKSFSGAVYAAAIDVDQHFTLRFSPVSAPGFDWSLSSASHYQIEAGPFRDVAF